MVNCMNFLFVGSREEDFIKLFELIKDNLVKEYNPGEINIQYFDLAEHRHLISNVRNSFARTPFVKEYCSVGKAEFVQAFRNLRKVCDERYHAMQKVGIGPYEKYNKRMVEDGNPNKCFPKVIVILFGVEELRAITNTPEYDEIIPNLRYILKVGRTVGVSIGLGGYLPDYLFDRDMMCCIPMRIVLPCMKETAECFLEGKITDTQYQTSGIHTRMLWAGDIKHIDLEELEE